MLRIVFICAWLVGCSEPAKQVTPLLFDGRLQASPRGLQVEPGLTLSFVEDHGAHPQYPIEWWYFTALVRDQQDTLYPLQFTLFRFHGSESSEDGQPKSLFAAHSKIQAPQQTWFEERFADPNLGNVGVIATPNEPFEAFLEDWRWQAKSDALLPATLRFNINQRVSAQLQLTSQRPLVLHGVNGYSIKVPNSSQASMYYSQPVIQVEGVLNLQDGQRTVRGLGWYDHEFSGQLASPETLGWVWFSLHLNNGDKLMLFAMRQRGAAFQWQGSYIHANGEPKDLHNSDIKVDIIGTRTVDNQAMPLDWQLQIEKYDLNVSVSALQTDQFNRGLLSYYEGAVEVEGSHPGLGFIELTGDFTETKPEN